MYTYLILYTIKIKFSINNKSIYKVYQYKSIYSILYTIKFSSNHKYIYIYKFININLYIQYYIVSSIRTRQVVSQHYLGLLDISTRSSLLPKLPLFTT